MSTLNPLNDISRTYLDTIAKMNKREEETEVKRWEGELNLQMKTQASLNNEAVYGKTPAQVEASRRKKDNLAGAPLTVTNADKKANTKAYQNYKAGVKGYKAADHMKEEEKKAKKDYDGDGKIESGKDEYFGSKDKAIKKAMGKKSPEAIEASRRKKDNLFGSPKNEAFSSWRDDLREIVSATPMTDVESEKEVTEKKGIKNKVIINPKMSEAVAEIGGELISEKEVDVKDTRRTVDAIRAYDRSKDASRDATYDTDKGNKKKGDIEKKYAKKERGEIDKDDPNWKKRKYHTGMHGEETEVVEGYGKKKKKGHDCASKVKHLRIFLIEDSIRVEVKRQLMNQMLMMIKKKRS